MPTRGAEAERAVVLLVDVVVAEVARVGARAGVAGLAGVAPPAGALPLAGLAGVLPDAGRAVAGAVVVAGRLVVDAGRDGAGADAGFVVVLVGALVVAGFVGAAAGFALVAGLVVVDALVVSLRVVSRRGAATCAGSVPAARHPTAHTTTAARHPR